MHILASRFGDKQFLFFAFRLERAVEPPAVAGYRIGRATALDYAAGLLRKGSPGVSLRSRLRRGDRFYVARAADGIAAAGRICFAPTKEVMLEPDEASLLSFATHPNHRRKGLYVALIRAMLRDLKAAGYRCAYVWADRHNAASLAGITRAGFEELPGPAHAAGAGAGRPIPRREHDARTTEGL